jgi:hypothetical protein
MATPLEVARCMTDKVLTENDLYQEDAVDEIAEKFGEEHVYENKNGNLAISQKVLDKFKELTKDTVVWQSRGRYWRKREPSDPPNIRRAD